MTKGLKAGRILLLMAMAALFWALTGQARPGPRPNTGRCSSETEIIPN